MLLIALAIFLAGCLLLAESCPRAAALLERRAGAAVAHLVLVDSHHDFRVLNALARIDSILEEFFGRTS
ncbi:hypothetical protein FTW19_00470 [Terriglobus albidus]|uniref:Uncharacterized protein n=1 Tax=Terriglobus albidus TaxID=1592106 RepID=A0A5B9E832_9BACT|nr:hypothetical protein [Terriglobus albidus]QEE26611.1 hypothetical protein FTW19_00470 [Terriglobus albidus]